MKLLKLTGVVCFIAAGIGAFADSRQQAPITDVKGLIERLANVGRYSSSATYSVLLPSSPEDIVYDINLQSENCPGDTLAPCSYLIEWKLPTRSGDSEGFSAYSDGSHYRYRDGRLLEYHFDWDSVPFLSGHGGVQRNAQFAEVLPQFIANRLAAIVSEPQYEYSFNPSVKFRGVPAVKLEATENYRGYVGKEMTMFFDAITGLPMKLEYENNPGAISEQTVSVDFGEVTADTITDFTEQSLIDRFPEVFERFRQSNFRIENMLGERLPAFSLPTVTAERFTHEKGESLGQPTVIVMLDPSVATTEQTVADVRRGVEMLPRAVRVIWAFPTSNIDTIEGIIGNARPDEVTLMSARALMRDTGANAFPTILFVNSDSTVGAVQLGVNQNLSEIVIEKTALLR